MFNLRDKVYYRHPNGQEYLAQICMIVPGHFFPNEPGYVVIPIDKFPETHGNVYILKQRDCDIWARGPVNKLDPLIRTTPHYDQFIREECLRLIEAGHYTESSSNDEDEESRGGLSFL